MKITHAMVDRAAAERCAGICRDEQSAGTLAEFHPSWEQLCRTRPDAVAAFHEEAERMLKAAWAEEAEAAPITREEMVALFGEAQQRAVDIASQAVWDGLGEAYHPNTLAVAIAAYERALWQPIETAPRDVDVEVWNAATGAYRSRWTEGEWPMGFWERLGDWYPRPTHWRPLPAGPGDGA